MDAARDVRGGPSGGSSGGQERNDDVLPSLLPTHEVISEIGKGTFGRVILAKDLRKEGKPLVAVKMLERGRSFRDYRIYVAREILHHGSLKHPFVIGLYEVFLVDEYLCIVMELAGGGDLFTYLSRMPQCRVDEDTARYLFQQIMLGLQYIHGRGVANRDLKLENILLTSEPYPGSGAMVKICDFGYSKHEFNSSAKTNVGTPMYMSPEVILGGNRYDARMADVWSCGIILYILVQGKYPFDRRSPLYAQKIMMGQWEPLDPSLNLSSSLQDLLHRMLQADPSRRCSLEEIFQHPWFLYRMSEDILQINHMYWKNSPDPSKPPLSLAAASVEQLVTRAQAPRSPGDEPIEKALHCVFPASDDLQ